MDIILPKHLNEDSSWSSHFFAIKRNVEFFQLKGYLSPQDIIGANILDFGGSFGQLGVLFLLIGASTVVVVDTELPSAIYETKLKQFNQLKYFDKTIEEFYSNNKSQLADSFDLITAHCVTEHVQNLYSAFSVIYKLLKPGGVFFLVHDNYYHPSGAHDNIMLQCSADGIYKYTGPECWAAKDKCLSSQDFRDTMRRNLPWIWDELSESRLFPEDCEKCLFFKRSRPWSHLIYQHEYNDIFPQKTFTTGHEMSLLNKITPFQLRQYILEAGFKIEQWDRTFVQNSPPAVLTKNPYYLNETDLITINVYGRLRR